VNATYEGVVLFPVRRKKEKARPETKNQKTKSINQINQLIQFDLVLNHLKTTLKQTCLEATSQAPYAFKDLMIHVLCNSHCFSHFAAFFIDTRAKISVVIS